MTQLPIWTDDGDRCATAYMIPKSKEDIAQRGRAYVQWARWSNGMFGRTPDYKNASLMAFAGATEFLAQGTKGQADFAGNMTTFYKLARKKRQGSYPYAGQPDVQFSTSCIGKVQ